MDDSTLAWPFSDPPNTAVLTNVRILNGEDWVHRVIHDEDDGAWQFLPSQGNATMKEAAVISLGRMVEFDPALVELADLPLGWRAWRDSKESAWQRGPTSPE